MAFIKNSMRDWGQALSANVSLSSLTSNAFHRVGDKLPVTRACFKKAESGRGHVATEAERCQKLTGKSQLYGDTQIKRNG